MKKSTNFLKVIIYIITYHLKKRTGRVILKLYREMWCKKQAEYKRNTAGKQQINKGKSL